MKEADAELMMVELNQLSMTRMSTSHQTDAGAQGKLRRPTVVDLFLEGAESKTRTEVAPASQVQALKAMTTAPRSGSVRSAAAGTPATTATAPAFSYKTYSSMPAGYVPDNLAIVLEPSAEPTGSVISFL